jgi:hypothetical protein
MILWKEVKERGKLFNMLVWRSCGKSSYETQCLTRRMVEGEIENLWKGGLRRETDSEWVFKKIPKVQDFTSCVLETTTEIFLMAKYILWDCLRSNGDIRILRETKRRRNMPENDAETQMYMKYEEGSLKTQGRE